MQIKMNHNLSKVSPYLSMDRLDNASDISLLIYDDVILLNLKPHTHFL